MTKGRNVLLCVLCVFVVNLLHSTSLAVEVHLGDGSLLGPGSLAPQNHLPVLFVHGHGGSDEINDPNYENNWQEPLDALPSFKDALDLDENDGLGIEAYYIRFLDQDRSITEDAAEIGEAIELILHRHDPNYPAQPTHVQVAVIAYSKGTISTRQYLKSLRTPVPGLPAPRLDFRPVSEFIAIAPPNHGIDTALFATTTSLAVRQLYNGYRPEGVFFDCGDPFNTAAATDYIEILNGHPIEDTLALDAADVYANEAPGSRADTDPATGAPNPPTDGTLYVTIFADGSRDFVGGDAPSGDCQGRTLALNLAPAAVNIPLAAITGGNNAAAVHQNTVHTAEVMCLALYAAVHHRSPLGQTCTLVGDVPVIPPPVRAAAMLTLDFSGSMSAPACPNCPTRALLLQDAVELFVQLWSAVGAPSDRLGVTYFRTNVDQFDVVGETLPLLSAGGAGVIADVNGQAPNNRTAMGGGLQRAIEALEGIAADTPIRRVILFTDGMQNVNPMVQTVAGQLVIANEPGRLNSNVSPATPPTELGLSLGIAVDTIGIGAGEAFVGLLQDIATATDGRSWPTSDPAFDLRRFFVEELINALEGFSPQLVAYRRGAVAAEGSTETFAIEGGARKLLLKVSWQRGRKLAVTGPPGARVIAGPFYRIFVIDAPAGGNWQLQIRGPAGSAYEAAAIVDTDRIRYDAAFASGRHRVGDTVDLNARLAVDGKPFGGRLRVTANLTGPTVAFADLLAGMPGKRPQKPTAIEPGVSAAERNTLAFLQDPTAWAKLNRTTSRTLVFEPAADGTYRATFRPQVAGIHTMVLSIAGEDATLGRFSRTLTATTVVRFGKADAKASRLALGRSTTAGGIRYVTLVLTPRDARGTHLGPGFASAVSVQLSKGRTVGGAQDLGDGRYMIVLALSPDAAPRLRVDVAGSTLYAGPLSGIVRSPAR